MPLAPAMAVFNGAVHLLHISEGGHLRHGVRDAEGKWSAPVWPDGEEIAGPGGRAPRASFAHGISLALKSSVKLGYPGNPALAAHDGALHLLYRANPVNGGLRYAIFDGAGRKGPGTPGDGSAHTEMNSRSGVALASYGGKLHAVYPHPKTDKLCHATLDGDEWTEPTELDGHSFKNTPALLAHKEGPAGAERETLLMMYRSIDN
ncbi:hypothetical protein [Streptomyces sp. NPDC002463]|uniref:hypothetical protein n=1 Tax=Streptomyces sp. NPDC002463 TaxID=3364645 RepID=UPI00369CC21C